MSAPVATPTPASGSKHPSYPVMVTEALFYIPTYSLGASWVAIKEHLRTTYGIDVNALFVSRALKSGVEAGNFVKVGARFKLTPAFRDQLRKQKKAKQTPKKKKPAKKKKAPKKKAKKSTAKKSTKSEATAAEGAEGESKTEEKETTSTKKKSTKGGAKGSKKASSKKAGPKKTGSKKTGAKKTGAKTGTKKTGTKTGTKKTGTTKTGTKKTGTKKTGTKKTGTKKTGTKKTGTKKTGTKKTGTKKTGTKKTGTKKTGTKKGSKATSKKSSEKKSGGTKRSKSDTAKKPAAKRAKHNKGKDVVEDAPTLKRAVSVHVLPQSGLSGEVHRDGDVIYEANLAVVHIDSDTDKFHKIQLVKGDDGKYHLVQVSGNTGTRGECEVKSFDNVEEGVASFEEVFLGKAGAPWSARDSYEAAEGKYNLAKKDHHRVQKGEVMWKYYMDNGVDGKANGWYDYDKEASEHVEATYQEFKMNKAWLTVRSIKSGYYSYHVNFSNMTQMNLSTKKTRKIQRFVDNQPSDE